MTHREFLEQLAEQGRVNEIIDKCLDLQKDIEALELDKLNLEKKIDMLERESYGRSYRKLFSYENAKRIHQKIIENKED